MSPDRKITMVGAALLGLTLFAPDAKAQPAPPLQPSESNAIIPNEDGFQGPDSTTIFFTKASQKCGSNGYNYATGVDLEWTDNYGPIGSQQTIRILKAREDFVNGELVATQEIDSPGRLNIGKFTSNNSDTRPVVGSERMLSEFKNYTVEVISNLKKSRNKIALTLKPCAYRLYNSITGR